MQVPIHVIYRFCQAATNAAIKTKTGRASSTPRKTMRRLRRSMRLASEFVQLIFGHQLILFAA